MKDTNNESTTKPITSAWGFFVFLFSLINVWIKIIILVPLAILIALLIWKKAGTNSYLTLIASYLMGSTLIAKALHGLKTNEAAASSFNYQKVSELTVSQRNERPALYWFIIVSNFLLGAVFLALTYYLAFVKTY